MKYTIPAFVYFTSDVYHKMLTSDYIIKLFYLVAFLRTFMSQISAVSLLLELSSWKLFGAMFDTRTMNPISSAINLFLCYEPAWVSNVTVLASSLLDFVTTSSRTQYFFDARRGARRKLLNHTISLCQRDEKLKTDLVFADE